MDRLISSLQAIAGHYDEAVLKRIWLQAPDQGETLDEYRLVHPVAHVGWIPPGNILVPSDEITIPCIVVGFDRRRSSNEEIELQLRITAAIYDPGQQQFPEDNKPLSTQPNFRGYETLLNLLDQLEAATLRTGVLAGQFELSSPVETRMYEDQPYPYWYGCMNFTVTGAGYPATGFAETIN